MYVLVIIKYFKHVTYLYVYQRAHNQAWEEPTGKWAIAENGAMPPIFTTLNTQDTYYPNLFSIID